MYFDIFAQNTTDAYSIYTLAWPDSVVSSISYCGNLTF